MTALEGKKDQLFQIFEFHLFNTLVEVDSNDMFIDRVVHDYISTVRTQCSIPEHFIETVKLDLREEIQDMLRKKTYGHFSLREYQEKLMRAPTLPTTSKGNGSLSTTATVKTITRKSKR